MGYGGQLHQHLWLDLVENSAQRHIVPGVLYMQTHTRLLQHIQTVIDDLQIELSVLQLHIGRRKVQQVINLEPIDDMHFSALAGQFERKVVADKASAAD
jgi:hypothetical protein